MTEVYNNFDRVLKYQAFNGNSELFSVGSGRFCLIKFDKLCLLR